MKTYDLFMYCDEEHLLELRLNTLKDVVDQFVLCEATFDFKGRPKPLHFDRIKHRYTQFPIRHLVISDIQIPQDGRQPWWWENAQRRYLIHGLRDAADDDIVMLSDVDEIPKPEVPGWFLDRGNKDIEMRGCRFTQYMYWFNGWYSDRLQATVIATRRWIREKLNDDMKIMREQRRHGKQITLAGWHFHATGGAREILKKLDVTPHHEFNTPENREKLQERIQEGIPYFGDNGMRVKLVPVDDRFPPFLLKNYYRFQHLFKEPI